MLVQASKGSETGFQVGIHWYWAAAQFSLANLNVHCDAELCAAVSFRLNNEYMLLLITLICNYYHESLILWSHWSLGVCSFSNNAFHFPFVFYHLIALFNITLFGSPVNHYLAWELALKQAVPQIYLAPLCAEMTLCWTEKKTISYHFRFIIGYLNYIGKLQSKKVSIYSYYKSTEYIFEGSEILESPDLLKA